MKKIYYILALLMMSTLAFTSCSKNDDDNKKNDEPETPAQTQTEKHFKSATAIYKVSTSNFDPYFNVSFTYLDENGKEQTAKVSDNAPFELTFPATLKTKLFFSNLKLETKDGVDTTKKPTCTLKVEYGFDVVDAITGETTKLGQANNLSNCSTFEETIKYYNSNFGPANPIYLNYNSETKKWETIEAK